MHAVQIEVAAPEGGDRLEHLLAHSRRPFEYGRGPDLGSEVKAGSRDAGVLDREPDLGLVPVELGAIEETVPAGAAVAWRISAILKPDRSRVAPDKKCSATRRTRCALE